MVENTYPDEVADFAQTARDLDILLAGRGITARVMCTKMTVAAEKRATGAKTSRGLTRTTVRGYHVKRRYRPVSREEAELKRQAIAQVLGGRARGRKDRS